LVESPFFCFYPFDHGYALPGLPVMHAGDGYRVCLAWT